MEINYQCGTPSTEWRLDMFYNFDKSDEKRRAIIREIGDIKINVDGEYQAPVVTYANELASKDEALVEAIASLNDTNPEHYTANGKPSLTALSSILFRAVTRDEVDKAQTDTIIKRVAVLTFASPATGTAVAKLVEVG